MLCDAALQLSLEAIRIVHGPAPWWLTARILQRSTWVIGAALLWLVAPLVGSALRDATNQLGVTLSRGSARRIVGAAMMAGPVLWLLATWISAAAQFTLTDSWSSDGRVLLSSAFYANALESLAPWILAGVALFAIARHTEQSTHAISAHDWRD